MLLQNKTEKTITFVVYGRLAQLVEQLTLNQRAVGSNPSSPTIQKPQFSAAFLLSERKFDFCKNRFF